MQLIKDYYHQLFNQLPEAAKRIPPQEPIQISLEEFSVELSALPARRALPSIRSCRLCFGSMGRESWQRSCCHSSTPGYRNDTAATQRLEHFGDMPHP